MAEKTQEGVAVKIADYKYNIQGLQIEIDGKFIHPDLAPIAEKLLE